MAAKILIIDIETKPVLGYFWGLFKQNIGIKQIVEDWQVLTFSAKWLNSDEVLWDSAEEDEDDFRLIEEIWDLLDQADIVVAHNGDRFDVPKINARMLQYGLDPYAPIKTVDTLKAARSQFNLTSNKLDFISNYLGFEGKIETDGIQLWIDCMNGVPEAWEKMVAYNIQDVLELEKVYVEILPWISNHPNVGLYESEDATVCPKCGGSHIHYRGYAYTGASKFRKFQCQSCGGWGRLAVNTLPKEKRKGLARNVSK